MHCIVCVLQRWLYLLLCTPTLEMGIDIGDLSSVILCSMPPAQSQFLQRAGRGGRKDGNALTMASPMLVHTTCISMLIRLK